MHSKPFLKSFMYSMKSKGPKHEPCGVPSYRTASRATFEFNETDEHLEYLVLSLIFHRQQAKLFPDHLLESAKADISCP